MGLALCAAACAPGSRAPLEEFEPREPLPGTISAAELDRRCPDMRRWLPPIPPHPESVRHRSKAAPRAANPDEVLDPCQESVRLEVAITSIREREGERELSGVLPGGPWGGVTCGRLAADDPLVRRIGLVRGFWAVCSGSPAETVGDLTGLRLLYLDGPVQLP